MVHDEQAKEGLSCFWQNLIGHTPVDLHPLAVDIFVLRKEKGHMAYCITFYIIILFVLAWLHQYILFDMI